MSTETETKPARKFITLARTTNPQGKPIFRVTLNNDKTVSVVIKPTGTTPGSEELTITRADEDACIIAIAEKVAEKYADQADGIGEAMLETWDVRCQPKPPKPTAEEKEAAKEAKKAEKAAAKAAKAAEKAAEAPAEEDVPEAE
jgi:hypothetical protein